MVRTNSITTNETIDVMDLEKLRQTIIDRVKDVDKPDDLKRLLFIVEQMILRDLEPGKVTPAQMRIFNDAIEEVRKGNYYTLEEENRDIDKWLEEN